MSAKESPTRKVGFLLTEVAMGLLDYKYFDLDGRPVNDLECLTKYQIEEEDYSKNEMDLIKLLKISESSLNTSDISFHIADTIDLDDAEDSNNGNVRNDTANIDENCNEKEELEQSTLNADVNKLENHIAFNKNSSANEKKNETESHEFIDLEMKRPNSSLMKSSLRFERVKYLTHLTYYEFFKIRKAANIRRTKFLEDQRLKKTIKSISDFYKEEKQSYEDENDTLISFMKVLKKSELTTENQQLMETISADIMRTKWAIDWKNFL